MFSALIQKIKSRTSSEWNEYLRTRVSELREVMRTQGEVAAVVAFFVGISFILLFKLWLIVIAVAIISYALVLLIADSV
jgi:hypothetical protein